MKKRLKVMMMLGCFPMMLSANEYKKSESLSLDKGWELSLIHISFKLSAAADTVAVRETRIPVLIERQDNELFHLRIEACLLYTSRCV